MNEDARPNDDVEAESAAAAEPREAALAQQLANATAELAETKDRLLRALAETENQRRRAQREHDDARRYAATSFAKDLLDVGDNLSRALASVDAADLENERVKALLEGVAATERALLAAFERHGIRRIEPQPGDRFDVNLHQAMFEIEGSGQPAGSIVQVLQTGYRMHDRLLRPALVGVAKAEAQPRDASRVDQVV